MEKAGLKLNIQKTKIMASGPITSWQVDGAKWKQWQTIFLGSKITADGDLPWNLKIPAPWKKGYNKPRQHIKRQGCHFANKGLYSQSYGFFNLVIMYRCESWTIRKAEHQRIDAFQLWCWRRLLRVSWKARRSHQSILKRKSTLKNH